MLAEAKSSDFSILYYECHKSIHGNHHKPPYIWINLVNKSNSEGFYAVMRICCTAKIKLKIRNLPKMVGIFTFELVLNHFHISSYWAHIQISCYWFGGWADIVVVVVLFNISIDLLPTNGAQTWIFDELSSPAHPTQAKLLANTNDLIFFSIHCHFYRFDARKLCVCVNWSCVSVLQNDIKF